jgi:integrase/recombinase XerD
MASSSLRDRVIIKILARTGMRRAELQELEYRDLDFERRRIFIRSGKGDKSRTVPVDPDTLQDVRFYLGERKEGRLIQSNKADSISLKQINEICAKCGENAGVKHPNPEKKDINPHIFRHSFARFMLEKGMRMEEVQKLLGHSSIKTTIDVYGTPGMESVQSDYDKIMGNTS